MNAQNRTGSGHTAPEIDNWDQHWTDFSAASENAPSTRYRFRVCLQLLGIPGKGQGVRLLEIGSGTGAFAKAFLNRCPRAEYLGLELSQTGVEAGRRQAPAGRFLQKNLLQDPNAGEQIAFQASHVVCMEVLEHVDEPVLLLRNATEYMMPGCRLIVTVPGGMLHEFYRHIGHRRHYSKRDLRQLLEEAGFTVERVYGAGFPFFNIYQTLIKWRGARLVKDAAGRGSFAVRFGSFIFDALFRLNLMHWGWQTIGIASFQGPKRAAPTNRTH
jgi:trans-aconitate methyltransferase